MSSSGPLQGRFEPGNGSALSIAVWELTPGEWPGTGSMEIPALVILGERCYAMDLGPGALDARWIAEKLATTVCDATAAGVWLRSYLRTAGYEREVGVFALTGACECGRHGL